MAQCRNCDQPIDDYLECPWCVVARMELLERLNTSRDKAENIAVVSAWAMFGRREQRERVWWVG